MDKDEEVGAMAPGGFEQAEEDAEPDEEDQDTDGDAVADDQDPDDDNDGQPDEEDEDPDGDGQPDDQDPDADPNAAPIQKGAEDEERVAFAEGDELADFIHDAINTSVTPQIEALTKALEDHTAEVRAQRAEGRALLKAITQTPGGATLLKGMDAETIKSFGLDGSSAAAATDAAERAAQAAREHEARTTPARRAKPDVLRKAIGDEPPAAAKPDAKPTLGFSAALRAAQDMAQEGVAVDGYYKGIALDAMDGDVSAESRARLIKGVEDVRKTPAGRAFDTRDTDTDDDED